MKQQAIEASRDWLTMLLSGIGIGLLPHQFFGGLFLALAAGSLISRHRKQPKNLFLVMGTSGLFAIIAVLVSSEFNHWDVAPQLIMAVAGGLSGWGMSFLVGFMNRVEQRSGNIADRVVDKYLPKDGEDQ